MTHYADLTCCGYFGSQFASGLRSIGWLDKDHPYNSGPVSPEFVSAIKAHLVDPWQPFVFAGFHRCQFCRISGGPSTFSAIAGTEIMLGSNNLYIPGDGHLFVAPSTIIHYIDAHDYSPPAEFQDAVLSCPVMRSVAYLKLIRQNAPLGFIDRFRKSQISLGPVDSKSDEREQG